jgi:cytoskeletal protein CcmA (bactofilin family)
MNFKNQENKIMRKNIVLMSVLATILSSCGASNSGPTGDGKKIANHKYTALESILVETTINTKTVPDGTSIKISKSDAIKENIINKGLVIMEGGTLDGTLTNSPEKDNENQYFSLNSGTIKGAVTNEMGRFRIRGGKIKGDFTSNGGATYIYGDKEARIDGEFKSTGKSTLNAHNNNTIRITTGPKHLSVKKAIFDENTKFSFVLTDDIQSSDKIPTHTLISSDQDIIFGSKTVFNFEKNNQKPIPKGKKVTVFKSPNFTLANPEITYDNTFSYGRN